MNLGRIFVILAIFLSICNLYFLQQLQNFKDFEDVGYREIFIKPGIIPDAYALQANVYMPFPIINLSDWMPHHPAFTMIDSGMTMYSVSFVVKRERLVVNGEGMSFPIDFMNDNLFDGKFLNRHVRDIPELSGGGSPEILAEKFAKSFLNLRGFLREHVYWGRVAYIAALNLGFIALMGCLFLALGILRQKREQKMRAFRRGWEILEGCKRSLREIQPDFERCWAIANNNPELIGSHERGIHQKFYEAVRLVLSAWTQASIGEFVQQESNLNITALQRDVMIFNQRVEEWLRNVNFEEVKNQAKKEFLERARKEFADLKAQFSLCHGLASNREFVKLYAETKRTIELIEQELKRKKIHEKRFHYVRSALKEMSKALVPVSI